jgi:hypothetical protein
VQNRPPALQVVFALFRVIGPTQAFVALPVEIDLFVDVAATRIAPGRCVLLLEVVDIERIDVGVTAAQPFAGVIDHQPRRFTRAAQALFARCIT